MDGAEHACFDRFNGVILIMHRGGRASEIIYPVDFQKNRERDIMAHEFEIFKLHQMLDVALSAGKIIVQTDHVVTFAYKPLA